MNIATASKITTFKDFEIKERPARDTGDIFRFKVVKAMYFGYEYDIPSQTTLRNAKAVVNALIKAGYTSK